MALHQQPDSVDQADSLDRVELCAAAAGNREAFENIYRRYFPRMTRFLRRFSTRDDVIEDVINSAMWVVWSKAGAFRGESRVGTWITGIAYRCMLKALRDGTPAAEVSQDGLVHGEFDEASAASPEADDELRDWVSKGLRLLPDDLRATMELAYLAGLSCAEIATVMGCAEGTVKARMFHARLRLRNLMPALAESHTPGAEAGQA
nr:RNA polymerase sigma factor [uncultured Roseateles sp.]